MSAEKWAVDTTNLDTGQKVRFIEAVRESTADLLAEAANVSHAALGRNCVSVVVRA